MQPCARTATLVGYLREKYQLEISYPGYATMRVRYHGVEVLSVLCSVMCTAADWPYETALLKDDEVVCDEEWGYDDILRFKSVGTLVKEIQRVLDLVSKKRCAESPHEDEPPHKVLALDE
jgi:hypothetical protein